MHNEVFTAINVMHIHVLYIWLTNYSLSMTKFTLQLKFLS